MNEKRDDSILYFILFEFRQFVMALVYSFCFWFSLRLGGILIGLFSIFQGTLVLIACCIAYNEAKQVKNEINEWINNLNLIYLKDYLDNVTQDPEKYCSLGISLSCVYIIVCVLFVYGAYICNNILMVSYILLELLRLIIISALVATGLLLLKQNTMDIGLLIGASVAGGFFLLGMFYLWICAANLPVLINEMERDEQASTISNLRQLLATNNKQGDVNRRIDNSFAVHSEISQGRELFVKPSTRKGNFNRSFTNSSRISFHF